MPKNKRSQRDSASQYADFAQKTHEYQWEDWEEKSLAERLRTCAQSEEQTAEAYSIVKEIIRRKTGLTLFDTQLMAAYSMQRGRIAELPTGEGKTLAAVVTASILALRGEPVHILAFNDYLACRDYADNLPVYTACGLTCGYIDESCDFEHRKAAYACDILYVSAKEAGFDYLRDFLCVDREKLLFPDFPAALVDEADSILIDEARIPLVLAGNADSRSSMAARVCRAVSELPAGSVAFSRAENQAWLTETGIYAMEAKMRAGNLYAPENADALALINAAIEARFLLTRDKDYIVRDGAILVVDESTGRIAQNRRFPDLLHQAVEMLELGEYDASSMIYNSMSIQAFLSLYKKLCGMTGTAASSASELWTMYDLEVDVIPPHTPCVRVDHPDEIFIEKNEQEDAILSCVQAAHDRGQPVLIGAQSVRESEHFSALLTMRNIDHCVLNAKNDAEEAEIIAEAGQPYRVTLSTNMAGRGVDIKLGGSDEKRADFVREAGGLLVVSTGINRSLRIDNQLRGRAGRQGDPGESRFFVCLKDLTMETFFDIEYYKYTKYPKLLRNAQKIQEGRDAEARYMLERYAGILETQRIQVSDFRKKVLRDMKAPAFTKEAEPDFYRELVDRVGERGASIAELQLTLYFLNANWATYLAAMEDKRSGIHLMLIGAKDPLDEYRRFSVLAFEEMTADFKSDVVEYMMKSEITEDGIDMEKEGLSGATTTWTYMINESSAQFSMIPRIARSVSNQAKGAIISFQGIVEKIKKRFKIK